MCTIYKNIIFNIICGTCTSNVEGIYENNFKTNNFQILHTFDGLYLSVVYDVDQKDSLSL